MKRILLLRLQWQSVLLPLTPPLGINGPDSGIGGREWLLVSEPPYLGVPSLIIPNAADLMRQYLSEKVKFIVIIMRGLLLMIVRGVRIVRDIGKSER